MSRQEAAASSKTYRKAINEISDAFGIDAVHTSAPSEDFAKIVEQISRSSIDETELSRIAEKFYRLGVKRGLRHATDLMQTGHFYIKGSTC